MANTKTISVLQKRKLRLSIKALMLIERLLLILMETMMKVHKRIDTLSTWADQANKAVDKSNVTMWSRMGSKTATLIEKVKLWRLQLEKSLSLDSQQ